MLKVSTMKCFSCRGSCRSVCRLNICRWKTVQKANKTEPQNKSTKQCKLATRFLSSDYGCSYFGFGLSLSHPLYHIPSLSHGTQKSKCDTWNCLRQQAEWIKKQIWGEQGAQQMKDEYTQKQTGQIQIEANDTSKKLRKKAEQTKKTMITENLTDKAKQNEAIRMNIDAKLFFVFLPFFLSVFFSLSVAPPELFWHPQRSWMLCDWNDAQCLSYICIQIWLGFTKCLQKMLGEMNLWIMTFIPNAPSKGEHLIHFLAMPCFALNPLRFTSSS